MKRGRVQSGWQHKLDRLRDRALAMSIDSSSDQEPESLATALVRGWHMELAVSLPIDGERCWVLQARTAHARALLQALRPALIHLGAPITDDEHPLARSAQKEDDPRVAWGWVENMETRTTCWLERERL